VEARREAEYQGFPRRSHYAQGRRGQTIDYYRGGQSSVTGAGHHTRCMFLYMGSFCHLHIGICAWQHKV